MALPLEGVRVLDLTNVMAGPYCATVLGDMGADIVKIEAFPEGDTTRRFEPQVNGESYCFAVLNRNKKSLALDMKEPRGKEIVMKLAEKADIVIENFRPGVVKKLGIDYDSFKVRNPGIIYASMSGFGQTGPYGKKGGFDIIAQGMSGIMMMTGYPGGRPAKVGIAMNDIASGVTALYGILGAYIGKLRFGTGQYLETSLLEAGLAWSIWEFGAYFGGGEIPTATGTRHRRSAPYQAFRSKDGYVTVGASGEKLWNNFATMVCNKPEWLTDPRFCTLALRLKNVDELEREIEAILTTQTTAYWVEKLDAAQVPAGPVYGFEQIMADPHIKARKMVVDIDHPKIGPMKTLGLPLKSTGDLTAIRKPAPLLGQHSAEVLRGLGYGDADIRTLFEERVIFDSTREGAEEHGMSTICGIDKLVGEKDGAIGWITFNNPARHNAVSMAMWQALFDVVSDFAADDAIRVIVVKGAGERAFVSGADISEFEEKRSSPETTQAYNATAHRASQALKDVNKPTIAMIRGYCIGGGVSTAMSCDLRIAAEGSTFAVPAAKLGLGYEYDGVRKLMDVVGPSFAKEIFYTARQFSAQEALTMGLINRLVAADQLESYVRDYAATIAANAPLTVASIKTIVAEALKDESQRNKALCQEVVDRCFNSADYAEGRKAFMEKRKPKFTGR